MVANFLLCGEPFCAKGGADGEAEAEHQTTLAIWLGRMSVADCLCPCRNFWERSSKGRRYAD
jgi:hypothetical protein